MRKFTFTLALSLIALSISAAVAQTQTSSPVNPPTADQEKTETKKPIENTTPVKEVQPSSKTSNQTKASPKKTAAAKPKSFSLSFDDLKFEMEKGSKFERSMLTDKINSYHNNTVSLRGFIRPSFSQTGLTKFIFVRDNKECCFGPGAALFDCVLVRLTKGKKTDFTVRPVTIEGKFTVKEYTGPDGNVWSIYRMNDTKMK